MIPKISNQKGAMVGKIIGIAVGLIVVSAVFPAALSQLADVSSNAVYVENDPSPIELNDFTFKSSFTTAGGSSIENCYVYENSVYLDNTTHLETGLLEYSYDIVGDNEVILKTVKVGQLVTSEPAATLSGSGDNEFNIADNLSDGSNGIELVFAQNENILENMNSTSFSLYISPTTAVSNDTVVTLLKIVLPILGVVAVIMYIYRRS